MNLLLGLGLAALLPFGLYFIARFLEKRNTFWPWLKRWEAHA